MTAGSDLNTPPVPNEIRILSAVPPTLGHAHETQARPEAHRQTREARREAYDECCSSGSCCSSQRFLSDTRVPRESPHGLLLVATRNNAAAPGVSHRLSLHHQQRTHVLPPRSRTRKSQCVREGEVGAFGWEKRSSCTEASESYLDHVERHWFQGNANKMCFVF